MAELRWGAATDSGLVREANEDAFVAEPLVFGVADGMGGHRAGEVASELASKTLRDRLSNGAPNVDVVVAAVLEANAAIFQSAHLNAAQQGMGTTVTALVVLAATDDEPEQLALVNVGDSRTYLHRSGELTRATVDHSYVQELVATGHITETEARTHPRRNIVTRALGIEPTVRVDAWVLPIVRGDRFILCSDGLVDEVPDHEIADVAKGIADPQRAADELVAMANRHGGRDNVTVVVVDVVDGIDPGVGEGNDESAVAVDGAAAADVEWATDGSEDVTAVLPVAPADVVAASAPVVVTGPDGVRATGGSDDATTVLDRDDTAEMDATLIERGDVPRRRRLSLKLLLTLLAIAAVIALAITLIAVAASDDDSPAPTTTTPTTEAPPRTTAEPEDTSPDDTVEPTSAPVTTRAPSATTTPATDAGATPGT